MKWEIIMKCFNGACAGDPRHKAKRMINTTGCYEQGFMWAAQDEGGRWFVWKQRPDIVPIPGKGYWGYGHVYIEFREVGIQMPRLKKWKSTLMYLGGRPF